MERQTIMMLLLLLDPRRERLVLPRSRGCCLGTQSELKEGPFARQEVLNRPTEPACSPKRERVSRPNRQGSR